MYRHLLVPTDGSTLSMKAVRAALRLARGWKARVTAIHVVEPFVPHTMGEVRAIAPDPAGIEELQRAAGRAARAALAKVERAAAAERVKVVALEVPGRPAEAILETARRRRCDLIVMASHSRSGLERFLLGSVTASIVQKSPKAVLVVR